MQIPTSSDDVRTANMDDSRHRNESLCTLDAAGALAEYVEVGGVDHGYDIMTDDFELIRRMYELIVAHVRRAIG
jgi:hypothetical protein